MKPTLPTPQSEAIPMFDLPPAAYGEPNPFEHESVDARRTRLNKLMLSQGRHPPTRLGLLDPGWGFTCGGCAHARHGDFWKCDIHRLGLSRSASSDIRKSWPACTAYRIEG
jgi:hypothetical protein